MYVVAVRLQRTVMANSKIGDRDALSLQNHFVFFHGVSVVRAELGKLATKKGTRIVHPMQTPVVWLLERDVGRLVSGSKGSVL